MQKALYAGSFDPITYGHIDVTKRSAQQVDHLSVAIGVNPSKENSYLFSLQERLRLAREALQDILNIDVLAFRGMLTDFAYENRYPIVFRGIRNGKDFEMEQELQRAMERQKLGIETLFLNAKQHLSDLSSSAVKSVLKEQGNIQSYVPMVVKQAMEGRLLGQYFAGVTGSVAAGKSFTTERLLELCKKNGIPAHNLDLDKIGHDVQSTLQEPIYQETRQNIIQLFGPDVANPDGSINRKNLGPKVFNDTEKLQELNKIMFDPMMLRMRRLMYNQKGLFLYNAALIAETNTSHISNNNTLLINVDPQEQEQRLRGRGLNDQEIKTRLESQFTSDQKKKLLTKAIDQEKYGKVVDLQSPYSDTELEIAFNQLLVQIDTFGELRFAGLLNRLGIKEDPRKLFTELRNMYDRPISSDANRSEISNKIKGNYHKRLHIIDALNEFYKIRHLFENPDIIECAILFHDIIYDPTSKTNEEDSAEFAEKKLLARGLKTEFIAEVKRHILMTKHDKVPATQDGKYLVDIDMSTLGKSLPKYGQYAKDVRREYYMFSDAEYKTGRAKVLQNFLDKDHIFQTEYFRDLYENQAKQINIPYELEYML